MTSPGNDKPTKEKDQREDELSKREELLGEISKVLRVKRWPVQSEPFRGFNSPPGRF